ncbi:MAG: hypothetical protein GX776_09705 [Oxalobacter sp.]|nr:hypothetical protein [Oxalobacter sp.]
MKTIDARMGLTWIQEGFTLFRKRPFLLTNLFIAYFLAMMIVGSFPLIGAIVPPLIAPSFSVFFLQAINDVSEERPFSFSHGFAVFNKTVIRRLFALGGLYFLAAGIAVYLSSFVDGGIFMRAMGGEQFEVQFLLESNFREAFMVAVILNFVALLLFWFVAPLIAWKNMPVGQSLFYNFFTILRTWKAFIVYLLGLVLVGFFLPMLLNMLIMIALGRNIGLFFLFSLLMVVAVLVYCSFYSMYIYVFGKPTPVTEA